MSSTASKPQEDSQMDCFVEGLKKKREKKRKIEERLSLGGGSDVEPHTSTLGDLGYLFTSNPVYSTDVISGTPQY